jgi:hypothetical protein
MVRRVLKPRWLAAARWSSLVVKGGGGAWAARRLSADRTR